MRENKTLSAWRADEQTIGCWLSLANAYSAEAIANLGFDWVCVDLQHGLCLLYTSPSPRDQLTSRMPSSA